MDGIARYLVLFQASENARPAVFEGVSLAITSIVVQGTKVTQLVALRRGTALAVFNLTTSTEEKQKLLHDLSALAENPAAMFDLTYEPTSSTSGLLRVKLEASYKAAANSPSVSRYDNGLEISLHSKLEFLSGPFWYFVACVPTR